MKKCLFFLCLFVSFCYARSNWYGDNYFNPTVFRSSCTCAGGTFVSITTQPVDFGGVIITSAGVGGNPVVALYDDQLNMVVSTIDARTAYPNPWGYGVVSSSPGSFGIRYNVIATTPPCLTILYQYKFKPDAGK